jgi:hypothetical protein
VGKNREKSGDNGVRYEREYINERNIVWKNFDTFHHVWFYSSLLINLTLIDTYI